VDFNWLHEIGCSCDDTELPEHFSSTQEISDLVAGVRLLLVSLPTPPRIITIARCGYRVQHCCVLVWLLLSDLWCGTW